MGGCLLMYVLRDVSVPGKLDKVEQCPLTLAKSSAILHASTGVRHFCQIIKASLLGNV
jgi:hypothetical protein